MTVESDNTGAMWAGHLNHLRQLALQRTARYGREPHPYVLWSICHLDTYACLMGNGKCDFVRTVLENNMLPAVGEGMPTPGYTVWPNEAQTFPAVLALNRAVLIQTAKLAQTAQKFRKEAEDRVTVSPGSYGRWQAGVSQLQTELFNVWNQMYPEFLERDSPQAGRNLSPRARAIFEHVSTHKDIAESHREHTR